jgi:hypothetical protein
MIETPTNQALFQRKQIHQLEGQAGKQHTQHMEEDRYVRISMAIVGEAYTAIKKLVSLTEGLQSQEDTYQIL